VGGIAGAAAVIAVITVVSRVVGLGRWLAFSGSVGTTCTGTAYMTANVLPNVLFEVVAGGALAASVVPLLAAPLVRRDRAAVDRTASALLTWAVVVLLPLSVLLGVLARPLVSLFPVEQSGVAGCSWTTDAAARMLVVFAPQVVLYGVGIVLSGVLQAHRRFAAPAAAPLLSSLVVIASYLVYGSMTAQLANGVDGSGDAVPSRASELVLSVGTTLGVVALSLPLLVPVARSGVRLRPTLSFPAGVARRARGLAAAGLAGLVAQQAIVVLTLRLSNAHGGTGAITVYQYVQAVYLLPYAVLAVPLAVAAFPQLSERAAADDPAGYAGTLARSTRAVLVAAALGVCVLIAVAPAVGSFFGAIDAGQDAAGRAALRALAPALTAFAPGLLGFCLVAHLGRALFAVGRARVAALATVGGWSVAGVLSVVLVVGASDGRADPGATLVGLGVASSVGMGVAGIGLLVGCRRVRVAGRVPDGLLAGLPRAVVSVAVAGSLATLIGRVVTDALLHHRTVPGGAVVAALAAGVAGAVVALAVLLGGLAVADGGDLRAVLRRRTTPVTGDVATGEAAPSGQPGGGGSSP
jgi:putative peptidoglycan lipid II flippase